VVTVREALVVDVVAIEAAAVATEVAQDAVATEVAQDVEATEAVQEAVQEKVVHQEEALQLQLESHALHS